MGSGRLIQTVVYVLVLVFALPAGALSSTPSSPNEEKRKGDPSFTLNRVCLYLIYARRGEARVVLPPLEGYHSEEVMIDAVDHTIKAVDRIRRQYPFADLELVSQSPYLLQVTQPKGGKYEYMMSPEPGGVGYSGGAFEGVLSANTVGGRLSMEMSVLRQQEQVWKVSLQLSPGRTLVLGRGLPNGDALFAVLTVETPESPPASEAAADNAITGEGPSPEIIHSTWDTPPRLVHSPQPIYPDIAYRAGVEGAVTLVVVVGIDGSVEEVEVARSSPSDIFSRAAKEAVMQWRYEPATIDGVPVRSRCSQTLRFVLSEDSPFPF
jgi:TonB family protein